MEEGVREARANGRSLIYEPGAAPPLCHNRIPGARARSPPAARRPPPPPRTQSRFRWRVVRSVARRVRFQFRTSSEPSRGLRARVNPRLYNTRACSILVFRRLSPRRAALPCAGIERRQRDTTCRASSQPASDAFPSVLTNKIRKSTTAHHTRSYRFIRYMFWISEFFEEKTGAFRPCFVFVDFPHTNFILAMIQLATIKFGIHQKVNNKSRHRRGE